MSKKLLSTLMIASLSMSMFASVFAYEITVTPDGSGLGDLTGNVESILGVVQWLGFIVGVAMMIWIGIKYITAGAGQKAEVKSTMIPWLVGACLVALGPTIAAAIFTMFSGEAAV